MERHDYFLLLTTATCTALGVASFLIMPIPSPHYPVPMEFFVVMTTSISTKMAWCISAMAIHICILLQWLPPHELFSYDVVFLHWMFTVESLGLAFAGVSLVYSEHFLHSCGGSSQAVCRIRCELSSWLALLMAALSIVDALVLRWATRRRRTHGGAQASTPAPDAAVSRIYVHDCCC